MEMPRWWTSYYSKVPASMPKQRFVLGRNYNERVLNLDYLLFAIVFLVCSAEWVHTSSPSSTTREYTHYQRVAAARCQAQCNNNGNNGNPFIRQLSSHFRKKEWVRSQFGYLCHLHLSYRVETLLCQSPDVWVISLWWTRWKLSPRRSSPPQR